jgi:hypothetical protein
MSKPSKKLSQLQRDILILLRCPDYTNMKRSEFSQLIYERYWGWDSNSTRANLSRAYRRLEERGYIMPKDGCWRLTDDDLDHGAVLASLIDACRFPSNPMVGE